MIKTPTNPGEWLHFVKRNDNIGLSLTEVKEKYRDEKILFESTIKRKQQQRKLAPTKQQSKIITPTISAPTPAVPLAAVANVALDPFGGAFALRVLIPSTGYTFKVNITKDGSATDYNIDWGDGIVEDGNGTPSHAYAAPGTYDIRIISDMDKMAQMSGGVSPPISSTITHILSWGNIQWSSMAQMFATCTRLVSVPNTAPDLSNVTDMSQMFLYCITFDQDLSHWDTSNVTNMNSVFNSCSVFNQPIGSWDTSNVTNMSQMFIGCSLFSQDLSSWNTSNVNNMFQMFKNAFVFDSNLSGWDVSNLTTMDAIFSYAKLFNNGGSDGINDWDITNLTSLKEVFQEAELFNQPLDEWDTSNITRLIDTFQGADVFNQDISSWDTSNVTHIDNMFDGATAFSQNLGGWDISSLQHASQVFIDSGMTTSNYDHLLVGWSSNTRQQNVGFSNDLTYSAAAADAKTTLENTPWNITDGGQI